MVSFSSRRNKEIVNKWVIEYLVAEVILLLLNLFKNLQFSNI